MSALYHVVNKFAQIRHPLDANARKFFHFLQSKKVNKTKTILLETQLKIANLKCENQKLTNKNEKLTNTLKLKSQQLLSYSLQLRGAHPCSDNKIEETNT